MTAARRIPIVPSRTRVGVAMTVSELIEKLREMLQDALVVTKGYDGLNYEPVSTVEPMQIVELAVPPKYKGTLTNSRA